MRNASLMGLVLVFALAACGDDGDGNNANSANSVNNANSTNSTNNANSTNNTNNANSTNNANNASGFVWEGEEVPCVENTAFEAQRPILSGNKTNPTGRGEQAAAYDPCNDRIILFGGNDKQPAECDSFGDKNYLGDTWAYSLEYENWYRVQTENGPDARGRHAGAFDLSRKKLVIFGGRYRAENTMGDYRLFNDTWAYDVNTDTWEQLSVSGDVPSPRSNSAMVYDQKGDRFLLFGGSTSASGLAFTPQNDLYEFDLGTLTWTRLQTQSPPQARLFHTMAYDSSKHQVIVFSGGDENAFLGPFLADVYTLNLNDMTWQQRWNQSVSEGPKGRINGAMIDDPARQRVVLFSGHDDTALGNDNDLWSFDGAQSWSLIKQGDLYTGSGCNSFCSCPDNFVDYDFDSPERRQYATFVHIMGTDTAVLFGGTGDCGYMDDTWHLDLATQTWTEVHQAEQGIACERTGRDNCEELCF